MRVGLHTGGVLLGGEVDADGSIRRIAVNIAAHRWHTAPAGALRISHHTCAQVRGLFEVDTQEPRAVKTVDTPMQSWLVRRAKPRNFRSGTRGIEGVATRMIGRDAELRALQAAFKRLFEHVDAAEAGQHGGDHCVHLGAVGHADGSGFAGAFDRAEPAVAADADGAFSGKLLHRGRANALRRAGDDADLVLQSHRFKNFSRWGRCSSKSDSAWSLPSIRRMGVPA